MHALGNGVFCLPLARLDIRLSEVSHTAVYNQYGCPMAEAASFNNPNEGSDTRVFKGETKISDRCVGDSHYIDRLSKNTFCARHEAVTPVCKMVHNI